MKILFDARTVSEGKTGVGIYAQKVLEGITDLAENSTIYALTLDSKTCTKKNLNFINTSISYESHPLGELWENSYLPLLLHKKKIELIHSPTFHIPLYTLNTKKVITVHDISVLKFKNLAPKKFTVYYNFYLRLALKSSDAVLVPSKSTKEDLLKMFNINEEKIHYIPLAPAKTFKKIIDNKILDDIKKRYKVPNDFLLFIGTIEPRKNLLIVIDAIYNLKSEGNLNKKLVVCGNPGWLNEFEKIKTEISKKGLTEDIIFTGYVDESDLPAFYSLATIFLYPSIYEGFGIPILEAFLAGCPVITSNISSMPEAAGDGALLVDPKDTNSLKKAIYSLIKNENMRNSLIDKGFKRVKEFSWEKTSKKTMDVYEKVLGQ